jgi:hypothetical protein
MAKEKKSPKGEKKRDAKPKPTRFGERFLKRKGSVDPSIDLEFNPEVVFEREAKMQALNHPGAHKKIRPRLQSRRQV